MQKPNPRYELGREAFAQGKTRIGGHSQPCPRIWCRRPECKGFKDAQREVERGRSATMSSNLREEGRNE